MKTLKFNGYSDDIFGEYHISDVEVDNCASGKPIQCKISSSEGELIVVGQYNRNKNGCWDVGISQVDEGVSIPCWPVRFSGEGYSAVLEIDVPDDAVLTFYNNMTEVES